jgi:hypothetical protein
MADDAPKGSGDFLRFYVVVMALMAAFLVWMWRRTDAEADDFRRANDTAQAIFGNEKTLAAAGAADAPKTISGLAVGVLKYLATNKDAGKSSGGLNISTTTIRDRLEGVGLKASQIGGEQISKYQGQKRFEEISVTVTIEPCDQDSLARVLYNVEQASPNLRILDVAWELRPEKENPYNPRVSPGNLIGRPRVKIGFRRPLAATSR